MTESEAIKEVRFNMSKIGLNYKSAKIVSEAKNMAAWALEKQIPMKVLHSYDDSIDEDWCSCPICCCGLGWYHGKHYKYCMNCGQKLDWSDDE